MRSSAWPPCIVTVLDLVGTKRLAESGRGSAQMIEMRTFAVATVSNAMPLHSQSYIWNDSVLLLSYETDPAQTRRQVLEEIDEFKTALERHCGADTYAISVKGLAFPRDQPDAAVVQAQIADQPRALVLKTSSWAMANCFLIEEACRHLRADWYIDSRITKNTGLRHPFAKESVRFLPKRTLREVHMYKGTLLGEVSPGFLNDDSAR